MTELTDLLPTTAELVRLRAVAAGHETPDLIVRGGLVQSPGTERYRVVTKRGVAQYTVIWSL